MFENLSIPAVLVSFVALLFSLSVHEASHAGAAYLLDDDTAAVQGRLSLNPLAHIDPIGTVIFPLAGLIFGGMFIGWAKPVPFDPLRLTRKLRLKVCSAIIASAGPVSNLLLAFLFTVVISLGARFMGSSVSERWQLLLTAFHGIEPLRQLGLAPAQVLLLGLGGQLVGLNVLLAVFNLIPLGPLDGAGVLGGVLPDRYQYQYNRLRYHPYTWIALFALLWLRVLERPLLFAMELAFAALTPVARFLIGA